LRLFVPWMAKRTILWIRTLPVVCCRSTFSPDFYLVSPEIVCSFHAYSSVYLVCDLCGGICILDVGVFSNYFLNWTLSIAVMAKNFVTSVLLKVC
jgi:hypothetical protein